MYEVVLDSFTGPMDLLLHLIRTQEVNIHDIPLASITDQYMTYIRTMDELSLDLASEFVVMAAWLLAIKSRMLLPRPTVTTDGEEEGLDPRDELVSQLLEYERCKWAATELLNRQSLSSFMASREPMDLTSHRRTEPLPLMGLSMWELVDAYRKLLSRIPRTKQITEIRGHVRTVGEIMEVLLAQLRRRGVLAFRQLLAHMQSRQELVSAFLALLELVKDHKVACHQIRPFEEIEVALVEETACYFH